MPPRSPEPDYGQDCTYEYESEHEYASTEPPTLDGPMSSEDPWGATAEDNYADDTPYIPPTIRATHQTSNARSSDNSRPAPSGYSVDPPNQAYAHPGINLYGVPDRDYGNESPRSSSSQRSGSQSSAESEIQQSSNTYEPSPYLDYQPPVAHQQHGNPGVYPPYDQARAGVDYNRGPATDHSQGPSHYRPQTHNYGAQDSPPPPSRHSHRGSDHSPPPPRARPPSAPTYEAPPPRASGPIRTMHSYQVPVEEIPDPEPNLRQILGMGPTQEISLWALDNPPPGEKPNYPYPTLTKLAIHGSTRKKLTLQEIYTALEDRFEWFKQRSTSDTAWKRSIRHLLSLNKTFRKVPRPVTDPGKGSYWIVDYSQGEGNKRVRKRNKKPTKAQLARQAAEEEQARQQGRPAGSSRAGPAQSDSDSEDSQESGAGGMGSFDDPAIDPALSGQGHRVGVQRNPPRSKSRGNPPYTNRVSSSESAGSPGALSTGPHSFPTFGHGNMMENLTIAQNQPAFGRPSFGSTAAAAPISNPSSFNGVSNSPSPHGFTQNPTPDAGAFSGYTAAAASFIQGRTLPAPLGGRAASGTREQNSEFTLAPIRQNDKRENYNVT